MSRYFGRSGGDGGAAPSQPEDRSSGVEVVEMNNRLRFLPDPVRIRPGDTVLWRNSSDLIHTVTADPDRAARSESVRLPSTAESFHSGDIRPGGEFRHAFPFPENTSASAYLTNWPD